jgi:hypothetical protein
MADEFVDVDVTGTDYILPEKWPGGFGQPDR